MFFFSWNIRRQLLARILVGFVLLYHDDPTRHILHLVRYISDITFKGDNKLCTTTTRPITSGLIIGRGADNKLVVRTPTNPKNDSGRYWSGMRERQDKKTKLPKKIWQIGLISRGFFLPFFETLLKVRVVFFFAIFEQRRNCKEFFFSSSSSSSSSTSVLCASTVELGSSGFNCKFTKKQKL